jgi:hypothetical protein
MSLKAAFSMTDSAIYANWVAKSNPVGWARHVLLGSMLANKASILMLSIGHVHITLTNSLSFDSSKMPVYCLHLQIILRSFDD